MEENEIHKKITYELFANLEKHVRINSIVTATEFNWRTIKRHLELMSIGYKERSRICGKDTE